MNMSTDDQDRIAMLLPVVKLPNSIFLSFYRFARNITDIFFMIGKDIPNRNCVVPGHFLVDLPSPLENDDDLRLVK